jgi:subtilisin family serine protease
VVPRFPAVAVAALTTLPIFFAASAGAAQGPRDGAPDRVIVAFDDGSDSGDRADALHDVHARTTQSLASLGKADAITVADGSAASTVAELNKSDGVAWAEIDRPVRAAWSSPDGWKWGLWGSTTFLGGVQNDFTTAWDHSTGKPQAPIAVVDTGVDFGINDLHSNEVSGGWDFVSNDDDPEPVPGNVSVQNGHGTHVAGIAAASMAGNDITGGAPTAGIMALRALGQDGSGLMSTVANAFAWAGDHGVRVVNASLTSVGPSQAVAAAITAHPNTLYVVAAGNGDSQNHGKNEDALPESQRDYPCALDLPNVICVAAVDDNGGLATFSNFGATSVDVAAPGVQISSYLAGGTVKALDGTSMATPLVAAAAELAVAQTPTVTAPQLHDAIIQTVQPVDALAGRTASGGTVDADALITRVAQLPVVAAPTPPAPPAPPVQQPPAAPAPPVAAPPTHAAPSKAPALRSPQLKFGHVSRSGSRLRVTGTVAHTWKGTVTVTVCAGKHCTRTRARVSHGSFTAKLKVARGRHVKITVAAPAVSGYRAVNVTRSARS